MALNLSTLTSPATSGDVLAEVLTTADFLEPVPVLRNLARGSQKGGDAEQAVALNQPKALPLAANGKGYLYLSGVSGNYASVPDADDLDGLGDFVIEVKDVYLSDWGNSGAETFVSKWVGTGSERVFIFRRNGIYINFYAIYGGVLNDAYFAHGLTGPAKVDIKITRSGTSLSAQIDTGSGYASIGSTVTVPSAALSTSGNQLEIGTYWNGSSSRLLGKISRAQMWNNATASGSPVLDIDFTATNVRHGATKFECATGQVVKINQSGNDPATIIKKPVLRFDGANSGLDGLFNQTITEGAYMFAAFSVLGDGGESFTRVFQTLNASNNTPVLFSSRYNSENNIYWYSITNTWQQAHAGMYDDERGDILHELLFTSGLQKSRVNNADAYSATLSESNTEMFSYGIANNHSSGSLSAAIDLEFLALFPATITDAQADAVRNYINNRNNVFDLKDGFGYYFYDAQKAPVGNISSGSASWNGRIVGSDNGDTDKLATQATANDQPVGDGYVVTFADTTDHLDIPSTTQAGWQVVGTSLGTFAYRVNANAVTELNLLGNLGNTSYRKAGDLYGIILLPTSATGRDINEAKKLLTDRGASVSATASVPHAWRGRSDIVQFDGGDMSGVINAFRAWYGCSSLRDFRTTEIPNCSEFTSAWFGCSALQSFPADAKLGTEANNVNFTSAWESSGLTSFNTPLPTANSVNTAWRFCSNLTSFNSDLSSTIDVRSAWRATGLTSFNTPLPKASNVFIAFFDCTALTDFSLDVFTNWNPSSLANGVFHLTWNGCTSLTAQSVENILVSIDASGKYATYTGASGGTALADAGIDIDYDGSGLTAATTAAITSLKAKGWSIFINSVEQ